MDHIELKENFTNQFNQIVEDIKNLESQISAKKEIALKLKGAIEGLEILEQQRQEKESSEEH